MKIYCTGYSLKAPSSNNVKEFLHNLENKIDMTSETKRYPLGYKGLPPRTGTLPDIEHFDKDFFNFSKNQVDKKSKNNNQNKIEIMQDYNSTDIDVDEMYNFKRLLEMIYENKESNDELIEVAERKSPFCENCNDDNIVEDTAHGIIVCRSCGEVLSNLMDTNPEWTQYNDDNKKDMNRCSHPISQLLPQSSTATTIAGSCSSRIKTLHGWSAMPYKERSLNEVFKIIQAKCAEGKILKCIEDDAKIMYKNISDCKHVTGKNSGKPIIIRGKNRTSEIGRAHV